MTQDTMNWFQEFMKNALGPKTRNKDKELDSLQIKETFFHGVCRPPALPQCGSILVAHKSCNQV